MFWTAVWFIVNLFFVASVIVFLFMHRAYAMGKQQGADMSKLAQLNLRRRWAGIGAVLLFVAMSASFVINMAVNG